MPYASAHTKNGARVGGGPIFWFFYAMFVGPLWLMWQMLKGAILLAAAIGRAVADRQQQPKPVHAAPRTAAPADANTEPQDAIPDWARPAPTELDEPAGHPLLIAVTVVACAVLATLAAISGGHFH